MAANRHDVEMYAQAEREAASRADADQDDTTGYGYLRVQHAVAADAPPALTSDGAERIAAITGQSADEVRVDAAAAGYDVETPTFDLTDETQLLYAFATDGLGYVYLLDGQRRVIARDMPADESHAAHLITMRWLLEQTR